MKKKIYCFVLLLFYIPVFALSLPNYIKTLEFECNECYRAVDDRINVRKEPNLNSKIIGKLYYDDEIYVDVEKSSKEWLYCYVPKFQILAYCSSQFFVKKPEFSGDIKERYYHRDEEIINEFKKKHICGVNLDKVIEFDLADFSEEDCLFIIQNIYESKNFEVSDSTVLISAAKLNYYSVVEFLVNKEDIKKDINTKNNQYAPALFWALYKGNFDIAKILLENGADPNFYTVSSKKAFDCISDFKKTGSINELDANKLEKLLLDYGYVIK